MRGSFLLAGVTLALAAGAACATSEDGGAPEPDVTPAPGLDAAAPADAGREAMIPKGPATCSGAGWCVTPLPDTDLTMIDIWPFEGRAFAVATSGTLGVKVMEWVDAERRWTYIDDNTQNEEGFGKYVGRIWAPNESEVYYAVSPGYIYHGRRAATWTWERKRLTTDASSPGMPPGFDPAAPASPESAALGVWGTSADDVYAWRANTIFHLKSVDGGAPDWVPDYVGPNETMAERVFVLGAGGSSKDDVWFAGGRGNGNFASCPLIVRKTPEGYSHVVDGVFSYNWGQYACDARPGTLHLDPRAGATTDVHPAGASRIAALRYPDTVTRIADADGGYSASSTTLPGASVGASKAGFYSLWLGGDDAWLAGPGIILRGPFEGDAGAYGVSTVALSGAPLDKPLYRVRGTDNDNLWAIGARYAFHKTTP
jgi:hypothetical protein